MSGMGDMDGVDSIGADGPVRPPRPRDPERRKRLLAYVVVGSALAAAVFSGVTAWETHQHRMMDHDLYCAGYAIDYETGGAATYDDLEPAPKAGVDVLDCDLPQK